MPLSNCVLWGHYDVKRQLILKPYSPHLEGESPFLEEKEEEHEFGTAQSRIMKSI